MSHTDRRPYPLFEWCMAYMLVLMSITLAFYPGTIQKSSFRLLLETGVPGMVFMFVYGFAGIIRLLALYANGKWKYGTHARALGSGLGAIIWGQMCMALALRTFETDSISLGVPVYFVLSVGEIVATYRTCRFANLVAFFYVKA